MDALLHGRLLCDTLRLGDLDDGERARLAALWRDADQGALVALALHEGAELWLQRRLKAAEIALADDARATLGAAATRVRAGVMRADAALARVAGIFASAGVEMVPLKSAALRRLTGRLPLADARGVSDVDLLVPELEADRASVVLRGHQFVPLQAEESRPPGHHHRVPLADAWGVAVELHESTHQAVRPAEAWRRATHRPQLAWIDGHQLQLASDTELLWHALVHANRDAGEQARIGLRLRYWLDGAVLVAGSVIDWSLIRSRLDGGELDSPELARAWLWWAASLAGRSLGFSEIGMGELGALDLPRLLAWRLHVLARHSAESRWREKLLEEGARAEGGLPRRARNPGASFVAGARSAAAALAARAAHAAWKAGLRGSDGFTQEFPAPTTPPT
ncbi:MAG: nucleotidyltransferase family protein [Gemmatimonadetes bacterium]|nr:nucleotidyltransferase family protein [Gemmatimonadota bacterium]